MNFIKKNSTKIITFGFLLSFTGLFFLPYNIRQQLVSSFSSRTFLWGINYLAYLGFLLMFLCGSIQVKKAFPFLILPVPALLFALYTSLHTPTGFGFFVLYSSCCIFSIYFIFVRFPEEFRSRLLQIFIILFNIIILLLFIWGFIDQISGKPIAKWIASFMTYDQRYSAFAYATDSEGVRFYSFFGHPLVNSTLFNAFFIINSLYNKHHKAILPTFLCCIISLISVAFCGSKTGLFVALAIAFITFFHNIKLMISFAVIFIGIILSGLMDNLITRLLTQSLTTGRVTVLSALLKDPNYPFHFLYGYGNYMAPEYTPQAFEFPFVTFSFQYGILFALLILGTSFLYVTFKLCKKGSFHAWLLWLLLFGQVNTYTCLAQDLDNSLIFYFFTMIILNICCDTPSLGTGT